MTPCVTQDSKAREGGKGTYLCFLPFRWSQTDVSLEVGFNFGGTLPPSNTIQTVAVAAKRLLPNPGKVCTITRNHIRSGFFCAGLDIWARCYCSKISEKVNTETCIHQGKRI